MPKKIAIIHDWLTGTRGGERILEVLCELYPGATLFTLLHVKGSVSPRIEAMDIRSSFIQRLPFLKEHYRSYLPLFPGAIERMDLSGFDVVLSVSHCVAKGAIPPPGAKSVCICLTPMRYVWDQADTYFPRSRPFKRAVVMPFVRHLREWDRRTADRVGHYVAISEFVAERIRRFYGKESEVIHPPVDCSRFAVKTNEVSDYYLIVSAFAPYKRVDLALEALRDLNRPLKIVGKGQDEARLRRIASSNVEFLGPVSDEEVTRQLSRCRALIFCGVEDFGIVPLEALASGRPVIAFGQGGVLETVEDGKTGVFFHEQTPQDLIDAIHRFEQMDFEPPVLRAAAERFDTPIFRERIAEVISRETGL